MSQNPANEIENDDNQGGEQLDEKEIPNSDLQEDKTTQNESVPTQHFKWLFQELPQQNIK